jgi:hypothetical protein
MSRLNLLLLRDSFAICKLAPDTVVPSAHSDKLSLLVHGGGEITWVGPATDAPVAAEISTGWRCFLIEQSADLSEPGILASVLTPLAAAKIGIFATSTFSRDVVLVKSNQIVHAIKALAQAGHRVGNEV